MRITCHEVEEALQADASGSPGAARTWDVQTHLRTCARCRCAAALTRLLHQADPGGAPLVWPDLAERVLAARRSENPAHRLARRCRLRGAQVLARAFRVLGDPVLRLDHRLQHARAGVGLQVGAPLRACAAAVGRELGHAGRSISAPLARVYEQTTHPLTGRTR